MRVPDARWCRRRCARCRGGPAPAVEWGLETGRGSACRRGYFRERGAGGECRCSRDDAASTTGRQSSLWLHSKGMFPAMQETFPCSTWALRDALPGPDPPGRAGVPAEYQRDVTCRRKAAAGNGEGRRTVRPPPLAPPVCSGRPAASRRAAYTRDETRTRKPRRARAFEAPASTIPPPGRCTNVAGRSPPLNVRALRGARISAARRAPARARGRGGGDGRAPPPPGPAAAPAVPGTARAEPARETAPARAAPP